DNRYWEQFEDLAQDIKRQIERLRNPQQPAVKPSGKTIYLAATTTDLGEERARIRRELELNGHRVLPDTRLAPDSDHRLRDAVSRQLAESHLAVHLIGADYGFVPEGELKSIIEIQRELASLRVGAANFSQTIWMPPGLSSKDERQQKFIGKL